MSTVKIEEREIPTFGFDQTCLFKQYFNNENVFKYSHKHNFNYKSWFEVAEGDPLGVRQILYGFFQRLKKSDKLLNYCSVERTEVDSSNILKSSVTNQLRGTDNNYLIKKKQTSTRRTCSRKSTDHSGTGGDVNGRYKWLPHCYVKQESK